MTLEQILAYANKLTEDGFDSLSDAIDYLNEAQELIARWDMIPAAPVEFILTSNEVTLPSDLMKLHRVTLNDYPYYPPTSPWGNLLTLHNEVTEGALKIWYYKLPEVLSADTPEQVPEVKSCYHRAMGSYAAKMYHLVDDDPALREAFKAEFVNSLSALKMDSGVPVHYSNL